MKKKITCKKFMEKKNKVNQAIIEDTPPIEKEGTRSPSPFKQRTSRSQRFMIRNSRTTFISKGGITRGVRRKTL